MSSFASKPFSPPEQLAGQTSEQSDVYALGVTFVDCFTDVPDSATPTDIQQIISNLSLHQSFKTFLRRMTSPMASDRHFNAMVAAEQIKDVLRDLRASALPRLDLHLRLSSRAFEDARTLFEAGRDTMRSVCDDLNSEEFSARLEENSTPDGEQVLLLGRELFYRAKRDNRDERLLLVVSMYSPTPSKLEKMRQSYFPLRANFHERMPLSSSNASASLDRLYEALAESNAHRLAQARGSEEDELLDKWQRILSLKQAVEHRREEPVPYANFTRVGESVIRFTLATDLGKSEQMALVGQTRRVITRDQKDILGEVDDVFDNQLDLYIVHGDPAMLNGKGRLLLDASASHTALARQRRALLEVRTRISRRTDLRDLLARPQESRSPNLEPNSV